MVVTFDLFSALTDSRRGGSAIFAELIRRRGWDFTGTELYDRWDSYNKALQRIARPPVTFTELSREALARTYADFGLSAAVVDADLREVLESVADWPLWPDVAEGLGSITVRYRVGILSNVDDALARTTRAAALVDSDLLLTSQRLRSYKPDTKIYQRAEAAVAPERLVHIAASARDVRGALESGLTTVRLVRAGHTLNKEGPSPQHEVQVIGELLEMLGTV